MRNRDMPAKPIFSDEGLPTGGCGLTKLEYAAIHIHAGNLARNRSSSVSGSINKANALFDQLEQENSSE